MAILQFDLQFYSKFFWNKIALLLFRNWWCSLLTYDVKLKVVLGKVCLKLIVFISN